MSARTEPMINGLLEADIVYLSVPDLLGWLAEVEASVKPHERRVVSLLADMLYRNSEIAEYRNQRRLT